MKYVWIALHFFLQVFIVELLLVKLPFLVKSCMYGSLKAAKNILVAKWLMSVSQPLNCRRNPELFFCSYEGLSHCLCHCRILSFVWRCFWLLLRITTVFPINLMFKKLKRAHALTPSLPCGIFLI